MDLTDLFAFLHQYSIDGVHLDIVAGWLLTAVMAAKVFVAATPTPDPTKYPLWSKIYKWIEIAGLVVGYAKHVPLSPIQTQVIKDIGEVPQVIKQIEQVK